MLIESKVKVSHDSMFNIPQANFKSAHLLNKMALVQSQSGRTVILHHLPKIIVYSKLSLLQR